MLVREYVSLRDLPRLNHGDHQAIVDQTLAAYQDAISEDSFQNHQWILGDYNPLYRAYIGISHRGTLVGATQAVLGYSGYSHHHGSVGILAYYLKGVTTEDAFVFH